MMILTKIRIGSTTNIPHKREKIVRQLCRDFRESFSYTHLGFTSLFFSSVKGVIWNFGENFSILYSFKRSSEFLIPCLWTNISQSG